MPVLTGQRITLPNPNVPIGTAVVRMPDGSEQTVEIRPSQVWLQTMSKIVALLNGNL